MPASRPAAPAALNTSHVVALNSRGIWLVDADANVPDLRVLQGNAVRSDVVVPTHPVYASTGTLGGHFTGNATDYANTNPLAVAVAAYPFYLGCLFKYTGTSGGAMEIVAALGDATTSSGGIVAAITVSDGTFSSGHIVAIYRVVNTGTIAYVVGPSTVSGTDYACAVKYVDGAGAAGSCILVVNGTAYTTTVSGAGSFSTDTYGNMTGLATVRGGVPLWQATSNVDVALWWYGDHSDTLSQANLVTWTNDPWDLFAAATGPLQYAYPIADIAVGSWQALGPGSETVRNLLTYTETFTNPPWNVRQGATVTANVTTDPNGGSGADSINEDTNAGATHFIARQDTANTAGTSYVYSEHVKAAGRDRVILEVGSFLQFFYLNDAGVVGASQGPGPGPTGSISSVGGGWYRCAMYYTALSSGTPNLCVTSAAVDASDVYDGLGITSLYVWGAQFEVGTVLTAYQPIIATTPPLAVTSTLYPASADGSTGTPDDATYDFVLASGSIAKLKLTTVPDPTSSVNHVLRYRAYSPQSKSVQVDLYSAATLIHSQTQVLTAGVATYSITLSGAEADAIADFTDIEVWLTGL